MRLNLTGRHVSISEELHALVEAQVERVDRIMKDSAVSARVVLDLEGGRHCVDVKVHAREDHILPGAAEAESWDASLHAAFDKVLHQAHTVKGKWESRNRRGAKAGAVPGKPPETATA
ncbi:MAG: ribosome-associated translation inhibitor RaiA [Vicinamibacterales bacterium]|nr:ribosome-associated translation inhibitor RaiA [Vicinamibacterales bacterium]MDP7672255.1 ribosome-associated translation inhibitor RaiA [Vicinamibacterales bacterium]HJO37675.1 ribosome-associated translation inhibitor RaiA [Vicinamibacterales bacterium]